MTAKLSDKNNVRLIWFFSISGVVFGLAGMCIEPQGEIHGSVVGVIGECFVMAGGLAGIGVYAHKVINTKINGVRRELGLHPEEEDDVEEKEGE